MAETGLFNGQRNQFLVRLFNGQQSNRDYFLLPFLAYYCVRVSF